MAGAPKFTGKGPSNGNAPAPASLPPAAVPEPARPPAQEASSSPQPSNTKLQVQTPGGSWNSLSLEAYLNARPLPGGSEKNPAYALDTLSTSANNAAVLASTGMISGPADPRLVQGVLQGLRSSGYLKPNRPTDSPSLVVFLPDDTLAGAERPYFVPAQPDKGHTPATRLPTTVTFGGVASIATGSGPLGGKATISVSSGTTTGLPSQPGTAADKTTTQTVGGGAGYFGSPVGSIDFGRSTSVERTASGELYAQSSSSTSFSAGWFSQVGPTATISFNNASQGPDPRDRNQTSVTAGIQATGPVANVKVESERLSFQAGLNKFDIFGLPVGSFIPGSWGAIATFRTPDERHHWVLDKASQSLVNYGQGEGRAALTLGAVGVGSVGVPFAIPGPDAVPQQRLKLPPEVVQSIDAREQSLISINYLDRRAAQTFAQTPDVVRAHLFEKASGGATALRPDGTAKSRQELETDLWNKHRDQNQTSVIPLETEAASSDERIAKEAQEKLAALRSTALQPINQLATPISPTFIPANAAAHVFPRGEIEKQTELLKNFAQVTGVSPFKSDGSLKSTEELNGAVWGWFKENNKTLVTALEERAASTDPAVAQDAQRRLEALRQVAIVAVAEPEIPTPDELRASIRQEQQRELREVRGGSEKPWERRTEDSPIGYRRPYDDRFSMDASHSVRTTNAEGNATATSRLNLDISTPDGAAPVPPLARRTGIAVTPQKTIGVTYEQVVSLSSQTPAIVIQNQINQDLKALETRILQQSHNALSAVARQGGSVDQTAKSIISNLPFRDISPRGDVTSQQLSFRIPGQGTLGLRASHTVEVITPPNGTPFAVAQIALETNRSGSARSVATWEQIVPLASDRTPEASAAAVRANLYHSIVGKGPADGILKTAARNGLAAVSSGQPLPAQLAAGFVPLTSGQSPQERVAAVIAKHQNLTAPGQTTPTSGPTP